MDSEEQPPPLPPPKREGFAFIAANLAVCAPMVAVVLAIVMSSRRKQGAAFQKYIVVLDQAAGVVSLAGAILAVVALLGMARHGRAGLSVKGLLGLLLNGTILFIFAGNYFAARHAGRGDENELERMRADTHRLVEERMANTNLVTEPGEDVALLGRLRSRFKDSSERMTGDAKLAAEAGAGFAARMQEALGNYYRLGSNFNLVGTLDFSGVESKDVFAERRHGIDDFLRGNAELRSTMLNYAQVYREEFQGVGFAKSRVDLYVRTLTNQTQAVYDTQVNIRDLDDALGRECLKLLSLMETNWGNWEYKVADEVLEFKNAEVSDRYDAAIDRINALAKEQTALTLKLREQQAALFRAGK